MLKQMRHCNDSKYLSMGAPAPKRTCCWSFVVCPLYKCAQHRFGKWKSLIRRNPSYREGIYTRGTPRKHKGESLANVCFVSRYLGT